LSKFFLTVAVNDVTKKWANLRTQFIKIHGKSTKVGKSGSAAVAAVKWRYYAALEFLTPTLKPGQRKSNLQVCIITAVSTIMPCRCVTFTTVIRETYSSVG